MYSRRTTWDASSNPLAAAAARLRAAGRPILDLTESNPTRVGLGFPGDVLLRALAHPSGATWEPDPLGLLPAREAIAGYYRDRGLTARTDRIVVTSSTSEAYAYLFKLLADPGDEVLIPEPSYPLLGWLAGLESVRAVGYPLRYDGEWRLDRLATETAVGTRTRAVVAVSPNNPTGSFLDRDDLRFLEDLCAERGLALLCDEVFADYPLDPGPGRVESVLASGRVACFALSGASKVAAVPQLKVGWLVAHGPDAACQAAMERLELIADAYLSPSAPSQLALGPVLGARHLAQVPLRARLRANLSALRARCGPGAGWRPLRTEGGWSAVVQLPRLLSEQEWALRLLEEDGVLVHPGFFFDFATEAFLVVSLLVEPALFAEAIDRLARRVERT